MICIGQGVRMLKKLNYNKVISSIGNDCYVRGSSG